MHANGSLIPCALNLDFTFALRVHSVDDVAKRRNDVLSELLADCSSTVVFGNDPPVFFDVVALNSHAI